MAGWINVPVKIETRNRLDTIKHDGQSYDKVINEILDKIEAQEIHASKKDTK